MNPASEYARGTFGNDKDYEHDNGGFTVPRFQELKAHERTSLQPQRQLQPSETIKLFKGWWCFQTSARRILKIIEVLVRKKLT